MYIIRNEKVFTYIDYMPVFKGLNVTEFGEETCGIHNKALCYRHNYIVHFVLSGTGIFHRDGKTHLLSPGKAFVITPKNLIRYGADTGREWTYCWISFSGTDCDTLFNQCGFTEKNAVFDFSEEDIAPLRQFLETLKKENPSNPQSFSLAVQAMSFEVLHRCAAKLRTEEPKEQGSSFIIDTAVAYMQANLHKPMNISTLCRELSISRTYFSTLFEATLKQPALSVPANLRIQRASELLLKDAGLHVYEVAEMVGFSSAAQFCKTFYKILGCNPSEYRRTYGHRS